MTPAKSSSRSTALVCGLPFRCDAGKIEFCLVRYPNAVTWELPKSVVSEASSDSAASIAAHFAAMAAEVGLTGIHDARQFDTFESSRGGRKLRISVYLWEIIGERPADEIARHWCLAAEAQHRLRRKPFRRLIDVALCSRRQDPISPGRGRPFRRRPQRRRLGQSTRLQAGGVRRGPWPAVSTIAKCRLRWLTSPVGVAGIRGILGEGPTFFLAEPGILPRRPWPRPG